MEQLTAIIAQYFLLLAVPLVLWTFFEQPREGRRNFVVTGIIGAIITLLLATLGHMLYQDPRPFIAGHYTPLFPASTDNGFPSDHALLAAFVAFHCFRYSKKFGVVLLLLALAIGASRVRAGVHHGIDVWGSFAFAAAGAWLAMLIANRFVKSGAAAPRKHD